MDRNHEPIGHDQLFQALLESFFAEFLELVVPHFSRRLRLDRVDFLREKGFTSRPEGRLLIRDLLARLRTREPPPKQVDFHVEVERKFRHSMAPRMRRYHHQRSAHRPRQTLVSIVLFLTGGPAGVVRQSLEEKLWGEEIDRFWYYSFGLEKCLAEEWVDRPQPLAAALAALMRSRKWSRAEQKLRCLQAIARADVDEERRFLLVNLVETYLHLTGREAERYAELVAHHGDKEVRKMELTWAGRVQKENLEIGREQGFEQGRIQGVRQVTLALLGKRFGTLPSAAVRKVEAMGTAALQELSERLLDAETLDELGLA